MLASAIAVLATSAGSYTVVDTGIVRTEGILSMERMNNRGEIIGGRFIGPDDPIKHLGLYWKDGKLTELTSPLGGDIHLVGINDDGVVAGVFDSGLDTEQVPFLWTKNEGFQRIVSGGGTFAPTSINNGGVVAGSLFLDGKTYVATWSRKDGYKRFAEFEGNLMIGVDLNDRGDMVYIVADRGRHIYAPRGEAGQPLATVPEPRTEGGFLPVYAMGLNNLGWLCGVTDYSIVMPPDRTKVQATLWSPDNARFEVAQGVSLRDLNDSNVAVGVRRVLKWPPINEPVVWDRTNGVRELKRLAPLPGLHDVKAINNKGEILCSGLDANGAGRWYILKPG